MNIYFDEETITTLRKHLGDVKEYNGNINVFEIAHLLTKSLKGLDKMEILLEKSLKREERYSVMLEDAMKMVRELK